MLVDHMPLRECALTEPIGAFALLICLQVLIVTQVYFDDFGLAMHVAYLSLQLEGSHAARDFLMPLSHHIESTAYLALHTWIALR